VTTDVCEHQNRKVGLCGLTCCGTARRYTHARTSDPEGSVTDATLSGIPQYLPQVAAAVSDELGRPAVVFSASSFDLVTPLLRQLHWLKTLERTVFKLSVIVSARDSNAEPC